MAWGVTMFAGIIVLYGALAGKLGRWSITAPMIFVAAGLLLSEIILDGHAHALDISQLDYARFAEGRLIREYNVI